MHIHHTHPDFAENFFARYSQVSKMCSKHPVFLQKGSILNQIEANRLDTLPQHISAFVALVEEKEKPLWNSIRFAVRENPLYTPRKIFSELGAEQKEFVKKHQSLVSLSCSDSFQKLIECAVISDTKNYAAVSTDYAHFQTAVDATKQLASLHEHLSGQLYLAKKIKSQVTGQSHNLTRDVTALKESHESQIGLMARLPQFSFGR